MKFQIWKLEEHSLQHMSSDHFTLLAYLVDTSLQKKRKIQDSPLKQPICIMECHGSGQRSHSHMHPPAGNCTTSAPSGFHCISLQLSAKRESGEKNGESGHAARYLIRNPPLELVANQSLVHGQVLKLIRRIWQVSAIRGGCNSSSGTIGQCRHHV